MIISVIVENICGLPTKRKFVSEIVEKNNVIEKILVSDQLEDAKKFNHVLDAAKYGPGIEYFYTKNNMDFCWIEYVNMED